MKMKTKTNTLVETILKFDNCETEYWGAIVCPIFV